METKAPQCIGFIMDGNRRWARAQNQPTLVGHKAGLDVLLESIRFVRDREIPHAVYYAFSTENWQRSKEEVTYLMKLFRRVIQRVYDEFLNSEQPVKIRFIGRRNDFSDELQTEMSRLEAQNVKHTAAPTTIWLAVSYGGRAEIIDAVNQAIENSQPVTEESFAESLWTSDLPDPDIIVRTSGEQRLSNFLTWGSAYSELYFIDKQWPALTTVDFEDILQEYAKRDRRRGK